MTVTFTQRCLSSISPVAITILLLFCCMHNNLNAATYEVGTGSGQLSTIGAVPWATLNAGDTVLIHWRAAAYKEKWVIGRQGTANAPITIRGVANGSGTLPVIDGNGAITAPGLDYWNEERSVIKVGGSSIPANVIPTYIVIENLDIRSARPAYSFTNDKGNASTYTSNAASITIERGQHITIRNCTIRDSGNGIFCAPDTGDTQDILIEKCHLYDNGIVGSYLEHNSYTEALGITFQYNHYGPLRTGCDGNNLKDRSAGTVIRYNWIESGNRQLDLVDAGGLTALTNHISYRSTYVYGNTLVENNSGNRQIIHYGGDSGNIANYRKGTLYLYNNTIVSTRTDRNTLIRLSSSGETCDARNNIIYTTLAGSGLELLAAGGGTLNMKNNWIKTGYVSHHATANGSVINDLGGTISGSTPGFTDFNNQDFHLTSASPCLNVGTSISPITLAQEYIKHQQNQTRPSNGVLDLGAYERPTAAPVNTAPVVNAGTNQSMTLPTNSVSLNATVTDDALPTNSLSYTWSKFSGPGTVVFGSGSTEDTSASFTVAGTYVLQLTASDGVLSTNDTMTVSVNPANSIRKITITLPSTYAATINPSQTAQESGTTFTFDDLNLGVDHSLTITSTVIN